MWGVVVKVGGAEGARSKASSGAQAETAEYRAAARSLALLPSFEQRSWFGLTQFLLSQPPRMNDLNIEAGEIGVTAAVDRVETAVWNAVAEHNDRTALPIINVDSLVSEYKQVLAAYLNGTKQDVEAYRTRRGGVALAQECDTDEVWSLALRTTKMARLSDAVVIVRPRILDGVRVPTEYALPESGATIRSWQINDAEGAPPEHITSYEVIIGIEAKDAEGVPFAGYMGVWMTRGEPVEAGNPGRPEWICTGISVYGRPDGVGAVPPML